jgi:CheY-like chemotaxis protein
MKILLAEDDWIVREVQSLVLNDYCTARRIPIEIIHASSGEEALKCLMPAGIIDSSFKGIISDCDMSPGKSGIWLLRALQRNNVNIPFLLHSNAEMYAGDRGEGIIDLRKISNGFPFAEFHRKNDNSEYFEGFIEKLL